jgi:hypothetical protein
MKTAVASKLVSLAARGEGKSQAFVKKTVSISVNQCLRRD